MQSSWKGTWLFLVLVLAIGLHREVLAETLAAEEAGNHVGKYASVKGKVVGVYVSSKGTTSQNFVRPFPKSPFTAVVFESSSSRFHDLSSLEGKTVTVKGKIKVYRGKPEIVLESPSQIEKVE
jgi:DNA/RNA endonuclease YhcR with UshA esterase domain